MFEKMHIVDYVGCPTYKHFMLSLANLLDIKNINIAPYKMTEINSPHENNAGEHVSHINDGQFVFDYADTYDISVIWNKADIVFKCQYWKNMKDYYVNNVTPFTYFESHSGYYQSNLDDLRRIPKVDNVIKFRGTPWLYRHVALKTLGLWNTGIIPISIEDYFKELASQRMTVTIPGYGFLCHRDIECLGLGVPLISLEIEAETYNPIIPGVHYIKIDKFEEVPDIQKNISDSELNRISEASMEWYDKNVRFPNSAKLALSIIEERCGK